MSQAAGKRILMLLENCSFPDDVRVLNEARSLIQAGFRVMVVCPAEKDQSYTEDVEGVFVYRYPEPGASEGFLGYAWEYSLSLFWTFWLTLWIFLRHGFDAIHAHSPPDLFFLIGLLYRPLGKKFVFDHHDISPEMYVARFPDGGNPRMVKLLTRLERYSCRLADHIISVNESYKKLVIDRHQVPAEKVTVVRNGPDFSDRYVVEPSADLRARGQIILGYVGAMGVQDGIESLVHSLHHLKHTLGRDDFYALLIGRGSALQGAKDLAVKLQVNDNILFTGYACGFPLLQYLSSTDICLSPDPYDPYSDRSTMIKIMEYMTFNKPIVCYRLTEHQVSAGEAALYAEPGSELDFAKQIQVLMDDEPLRHRMGELGRKRVEENLAWSHQAPHLVSVYRSLWTSHMTAPEAA